jgi:hypothetical protein
LAMFLNIGHNNLWPIVDSNYRFYVITSTGSVKWVESSNFRLLRNVHCNAQVQ